MLYEISAARPRRPPARSAAISASTPAISAASCARFEKRGPDPQAGLADRRAAEPAVADGARPQGVRAARSAHASTAGRRHARRARAPQPGAAGRGDAHGRDAAGDAEPKADSHAYHPARAARRAISAGSSTATACSMRRNTAGANSSKALCAQIVADFVNNFDPKRERCWIAERDGENVGSVLLVKDTDRGRAAAAAAGRAVGARARHRRRGWSTNASASRAQRGYREITLWTHSVLTAARHIYEQRRLHA